MNVKEVDEKFAQLEDSLLAVVLKYLGFADRVKFSRINKRMARIMGKVWEEQSAFGFFWKSIYPSLRECDTCVGDSRNFRIDCLKQYEKVALKCNVKLVDVSLIGWYDHSNDGE